MGGTTSRVCIIAGSRTSTTEELTSQKHKAHYSVGVKPATAPCYSSLTACVIACAALLLSSPAHAHFTLMFTGASGQPTSWQEGAFTVTGNWTPDAGINIYPGQLETGSWLQGGDYIASYQGQNSNWLEISRQGVPFSPLNFEIAERSGTQTFIASTGAQLSVTGAVGDLFFFPPNDPNWADLDWLVLYTSSGSLGIDGFSMNVCPDPKIWGPYNVAEGGGVMMYSYAEGLGAIYNWDLDNDGEYDDASGTSTLFNASNLNGPGTHTVGLEVTADCGLSGITTGTTTTLVSVSNVAPSILSLTGDLLGDEGEPLTWEVTWSDPGSSDSHSITWDPGDGSVPVVGSNTFTHSYNDEGTYTLEISIVDSDGGSAEDSMQVTVVNQAPTLSNFLIPSGAEGQNLVFEITVSDPGTSDVVDYQWDFGDGSTASGATTVEHIYADDGTYNVTFTASDQDGGIAALSAAVTVDNLAPVITSISVPTNSNEGEVISLSAQASDVASDSISYTWDFGDGASQQVGNPIAYSWELDGHYTVTVIASDDSGATSMDTSLITVHNLAPSIDQVSLPPGPHNEGESVLFSIQASDAGNDPLNYLWQFGDGSSASSGPQASHSFSNEGSYTVSVIVSDDEGATEQVSGVVSVVNAAPQILSLSGNSSGLEGQPLSWTAQVSDPGPTDTVTGSWNFGDGSPTSTGLSATHTYQDDGVFTIEFTATDDQGAASSSTLTVSVSNEGPVITSLQAPNGNEGEVLSFSGSATDAGNDTLTYSWDFGDGSPAATGSSVTHTYSDDGTFSVTLTVRDEDNGIATAVAPTSIANLPPQVTQVSGPTSGQEGQALTFSVAASDPSSVDAASLAFTWDFGDGSPPSDGCQPQPHLP